MLQLDIEKTKIRLVVANLTVTHQTPMIDRWGGWYVTGRTGNDDHQGNLPDDDAVRTDARFSQSSRQTDPIHRTNVLRDRFEDIANLMASARPRPA